MSKRFGALVKQYRQHLGVTMREFCLTNGFDAGNFSRLERGMYPPPESREKLEIYAHALGLTPGSDGWTDFFDVASVERGAIPEDLMDDAALVEKLPVFFRTLRTTLVDPESLDKLIDQIRST